MSIMFTDMNTTILNRHVYSWSCGRVCGGPDNGHDALIVLNGMISFVCWRRVGRALSGRVGRAATFDRL